MAEEGMRRFWDRRAVENPYYFVDNRLDYRSPDLDRFWADGEPTLETLLADVDVAIRPSDTVVEIGCGVGRLTRAIAARAATVVAVDVSERMLTLARQHNPDLSNVSWLLGDGASLAGVNDGSADGCVSHVVFQHIPDPEITLSYVREMGRVLRPGGWAAFQVSNDPQVHRPRALLRQRLLRLVGLAPAGQSHPAWLGSAVEVAALERAARDGGTELEQIRGEGTQWCEVLLRKPGLAP